MSCPFHGSAMVLSINMPAGAGERSIKKRRHAEICLLEYKVDGPRHHWRYRECYRVYMHSNNSPRKQLFIIRFEKCQFHNILSFLHIPTSFAVIDLLALAHLNTFS